MIKNNLRISYLWGVILLILYQNAFSHPFYPSPIGTPENPTINGGRIDTRIKKTIVADADRTQAVLTVKQPYIKKNPTDFIESAQPEKKSFPDDWMDSQKIQSVLKQAAIGGKLSYVIKKAQEKGLPLSVAIIPIIESRYNTQALSPKGAAGAWQIMPSVAKDYGIDNAKRFDFETSTNVALNYLKDLHAKWKSWDLALAAYNAGSGRLLKAIRRKPTATHVDELDLPQETHLYLRRFKKTHQALGEMVGYET